MLTKTKNEFTCNPTICNDYTTAPEDVPRPILFQTRFPHIHTTTTARLRKTTRLTLNSISHNGLTKLRSHTLFTYIILKLHFSCFKDNSKDFKISKCFYKPRSKTKVTVFSYHLPCRIGVPFFPIHLYFDCSTTSFHSRNREPSFPCFLSSQLSITNYQYYHQYYHLKTPFPPHPSVLPYPCPFDLLPSVA
jgi:hypothetical protein